MWGVRMAEAREPNPRNGRRRLSAAFVRTVKHPGRYHDGDGLFLQVDATGAKRWVQRLVVRGKRRDIGLGSARLVSLAEARDAALANRKEARAGGDPLATRRRERAVPTFMDAARKVYEIRRDGWRNPKHAAQFLSTLETYAGPHFGDRRVDGIAPADVLAVLTPIWQKKPETARRVKQRLGMVFEYAVAQGWRPDNPAAAVGRALPRQDARPERRKALPYAGVPAVLAAVDRSNAAESTRLALRLLILTAARSAEVRLARWDEIDREAAIWTRPASRMKSKVAHRVPLSRQALDVLQRAESLAGTSGLIFPSARPGRPMSDATMLKLVRTQGFDVDVHGFRTSFRVWAQEQTDAPREVAERALAHTIANAAEAAYARSDLFEKRRELMQRWADYLDGEPGAVVPLHA